MRKILSLLLFIPIVSYSQITFSDLMSINCNENTFKRVVIENGYELNEGNSKNGQIVYGLNVVKDPNGDWSNGWATFFKSEFRFEFFKTSIQTYDEIVKDIKKNCKYYEIRNKGGIDYVCYECSDNVWVGEIGFVISEGSGFIRNWVSPLIPNNLR